MIPGLPPQSPAETWIGYDAEENPYLLRWRPGRGAFVACGFRPEGDGAVPWSVVVSGGNFGFIVGHDEVPSR